MPRIVIENLFNKTLNVSALGRPLLRHLQDNRIDWMQACGGKGRCTTCKVIITEGESNCSELTASEKRYLSEGALKAHERLACQIRISGDITIITPDEYKLPHMQYSDDD